MTYVKSVCRPELLGVSIRTTCGSAASGSVGSGALQLETPFLTPSEVGPLTLLHGARLENLSPFSLNET